MKETVYSEVEHTLTSLHWDNLLFQGIIQKQDRQIHHLQKELTQLKRSNMRNNLIISGLGNDRTDANTQKQVEDF